MSDAVLRWSQRGALLIAVGLGVSHHFLSRHLVQTRPRIADPEIGATHYFKGVDGIAYLTTSEHFLVQGLWFGAFAVMVVAVALQFVIHRSSRSK